MSKKNTGGSGMTMFLGGIGAGIVGGRLLPPLFAALMGSRRVRAGGDPFALLISDHREILSTLDQMVAAPSDSTMRKSRLFLMLKRRLAKHAMAEEDVVYPIVHNRSAEGDDSKHLYDEHADMKILLYEIENQLKNGEDWTASVSSLRNLIRHHVDDEENQVFPRLRQALSSERSPKVSAQISREEALIV